MSFLFEENDCGLLFIGTTAILSTFSVFLLGAFAFILYQYIHLKRRFLGDTEEKGIVRLSTLKHTLKQKKQKKKQPNTFLKTLLKEKKAIKVTPSPSSLPLPSTPLLSSIPPSLAVGLEKNWLNELILQDQTIVNCTFEQLEHVSLVNCTLQTFFTLKDCSKVEMKTCIVECQLKITKVKSINAEHCSFKKHLECNQLNWTPEMQEHHRRYLGSGTSQELYPCDTRLSFKHCNILAAFFTSCAQCKIEDCNVDILTISQSVLFLVNRVNLKSLNLDRFTHVEVFNCTFHDFLDNKNGALINCT